MALYLGLRTDTAVAEMYLYEDDVLRARESWEANRELAKQLLAKLDLFLESNKVAFSELNGLLVYEGPGSFTGLRIGLTVINTMAYSLTIPVVGAQGDAWIETALGSLARGENDEIVLPFYGAEACITKPRK